MTKFNSLPHHAKMLAATHRWKYGSQLFWNKSHLKFLLINYSCSLWVTWKSFPKESQYNSRHGSLPSTLIVFVVIYLIFVFTLVSEFSPWVFMLSRCPPLGIFKHLYLEQSKILFPNLNQLSS